MSRVGAPADGAVAYAIVDIELLKANESLKVDHAEFECEASFEKSPFRSTVVTGEIVRLAYLLDTKPARLWRGRERAVLRFPSEGWARVCHSDREGTQRVSLQGLFVDGWTQSPWITVEARHRWEHAEPPSQLRVLLWVGSPGAEVGEALPGVTGQNGTSLRRLAR